MEGVKNLKININICTKMYTINVYNVNSHGDYIR